MTRTVVPATPDESPELALRRHALELLRQLRNAIDLADTHDDGITLSEIPPDFFKVVGAALNDSIDLANALSRCRAEYQALSAISDERLRELQRAATPTPPYAFVQWKGTTLCADVHCLCGESGHVDAGFAYFLRCRGCSRVYETASHVGLAELSEAELIAKRVDSVVYFGDDDACEDDT